MPRRPLPQRSRHRGFALMALLVLLTLGGLYFFVNNLTPAAVAERRPGGVCDPAIVAVV
mgnify:CR=1 FL=1